MQFQQDELQIPWIYVELVRHLAPDASNPLFVGLIKAPSRDCYTWQLVPAIYKRDYGVNL